MDVFTNAPTILAEQLPLLLAGSLKALVVLLITAIMAFLLRKRGAAIRHWVWSLGLIGALLIPILAVTVPAWNVRVSALPLQTDSDPVVVHEEVHEEALPAAEAESIADPLPEEATAPRPDEASALPVEEPQEAEAASGAAVSQGPDNQSAKKSGEGPVWPMWVFALWLGGAMLVSLYFAAGSLHARWLTRCGHVMHDGAWNDTLRAVCQELRIERKVQLVASRHTAMPFTWGITRPVIVLPHTASSWSAERRRIVLLHEAAHIKRWDCLSQAIAQLACALYWFNPLVWWVARQLRIERERATDEYVLAVGTRPSTYAEHLLDLARSLGATRGAPFGAVSMAKPSQLEGRLLSILRSNGENTMLSRIGAVATGLAFCALLLPLAAMHPVPSETGEVPGPFPLNEYVNTDTSPGALSKASVEQPPVDSSSRAAVDTLIEHSFRVQEGGQLNVDADMGSITVETGVQNRVHVEVHISGGDTENLDWFDADFEQRDNDVFVTAEVEDRNGFFSWLRGRSSPSVRYVVTVPPRYNVDLNTQGGSIEVGDLQGTVNLRTAGGSLRLGQIDGPIDAQTAGGSIQLEGSTADVRAHTSGGSITLGPVQGTVDANTSGGSIRINGAAGAVQARTSGGSITAHITEQPQGNSELRTAAGSISVYLAEGIGLDVNARATAGRVVADLPVEAERTSRSQLQGTIGGGGPQLVARTSAGNINFRPLDASADAASESFGFHFDPEVDFHFDEEDIEWAEDYALEMEQAIEEAMREVEREMESLSAELEHEVELAMAGVDLQPVVDVAHETATAALLEVVRELDREVPEGWAKQSIAAAAAGMLERKAYEQATLTVTIDGETEEVPIVTLLAELPGQAGYPALSRLAEDHPDPEIRRQAEEARNSMR